MYYNAAKPTLELPAGLIEELLQKNEKVGSNLLKSIEEIQKHKKTIRDWLENNDYLDLVTNLPDVEIPTTCGIDGSFVVEHLLSTSVVACAAVAIEGFTPPSETKHWPLKFNSLVEVENHEPEINTMIRGLMKIMETTLAINAPHDVILLDGSVTSQIIHMNQAMSKAYDNNKSKIIGDKLKEDYENFLQCFDVILKNSDSRIWASLPKFTTRSEIGDQYDDVNGWPEKQDDRSVLTALLKPGEYTKPIRITTTKDNWHLTPHENSALGETHDCIIKSLNKQLVFYYKPKEFTPALRIEIAESIGTDDVKLATVMKSLDYQFASYAIMEPYPLYMADRMVKNLSGAIPALRQAALQKVAGKSDAELQQILFSLRGYRTEGGR